MEMKCKTAFDFCSRLSLSSPKIHTNTNVDAPHIRRIFCRFRKMLMLWLRPRHKTRHTENGILEKLIKSYAQHVPVIALLMEFFVVSLFVFVRMADEGKGESFPTHTQTYRKSFQPENLNPKVNWKSFNVFGWGDASEAREKETKPKTTNRKDRNKIENYRIPFHRRNLTAIRFL